VVDGVGRRRDCKVEIQKPPGVYRAGVQGTIVCGLIEWGSHFILPSILFFFVGGITDDASLVVHWPMVGSDGYHTNVLFVLKEPSMRNCVRLKHRPPCAGDAALLA